MEDAASTHLSEAKLTEKQREALTQQVRKTLESGRSIAVVGWRDSNHGQFTRKLPMEKVIFLGNSSKNIPEKAGLILLTRFMHHADFRKIKSERDKDCYSKVLGTGQIKRILESCKDLLIPAPHSPVAVETPKTMATVEPIVMATPAITCPDDVLDFCTATRRCEMSEMDKLTRAFLSAANANPVKPGYVSRITLGQIRKECGVTENNPQLANAGWIVSEISEGKARVGWYKPGPKMLANSEHEKFEPEDPVERARFLIAQKEPILVRKAELEDEFEAVKKELARIEMAERLFGQIKELMEPK